MNCPENVLSRNKNNISDTHQYNKTAFYVLLRKYSSDLCTIKPKLSVVELIFVKFERKTMLLWNDIQRKNKI